MVARAGLSKTYFFMGEYMAVITYGPETLLLLGRAKYNGIADQYTHAHINEELPFAYADLASAHRRLEELEKALHDYEQAVKTGMTGTV
ncbi:hypothetical protein HBH70_178270 [Parastagonospora nodorum]|nr:hypothetical protein HBH46_072980 [Parastagonospora nodorum]KAH4114932.1 hypothetical protein HBH47_189990 [Parastagonospora nodorum]KAH4600613.1 hypothetical protein HBH82_188560 [Parastagonospora nodorum]KAH4672217.1 hypothetical protein HBH78_176900 [Parastagonospora nodorum]KAH4696838.1 hypothetical protein HBH67_187310 [Parastagonospora nodorum]